MKNELERIWANQPLAFALHITKWEAIHKTNGLWFWFDSMYKFIARRGKRLDPIKRNSIKLRTLYSDVWFHRYGVQHRLSYGVKK